MHFCLLFSTVGDFIHVITVNLIIYNLTLIFIIKNLYSKSLWFVVTQLVPGHIHWTGSKYVEMMVTWYRIVTTENLQWELKLSCSSSRIAQTAATAFSYRRTMAISDLKQVQPLVFSFDEWINCSHSLLVLHKIEILGKWYEIHSKKWRFVCLLIVIGGATRMKSNVMAEEEYDYEKEWLGNNKIELD